VQDFAVSGVTYDGDRRHLWASGSAFSGRHWGVFHHLGERVDLSRRRAWPLAGAASSAAVDRQGTRLTSSSHLRATSLGAILLALALGLSACGSDDPEATDDPTATASTSVTPSPTPTPTAEPLSPFEDLPPVKAARAWAVAMARAVNAGDRSVAAVAPLATARGLDLSRTLAKADIDANLLRPGPAPFTPVNVQVKKRNAKLSLCYLTYGWSVDRKTNKPAEARKVEAIVFDMRRVEGRWKFEYGQQGTGDCKGVHITPVRF